MLVVPIRSVVWFATGAVISLVATLALVQAWSAGAAPGDADTTFVPVTPCRLLDTRPGSDNVGLRSTPLGPNDTHVQQVTGSNGNCIGIPSTATAVAMNVTIVNPTAQSNLRLYPADVVDPPLVSNLNWLPGQSPTPNKVDVKLSPDGKVKLLNFQGTVDVIGDVVGYYTNSSLVELSGRVGAIESSRSFAVHETENLGFDPVTTDRVVESVSVTAPAAGTVTVVSSVVVAASMGSRIVCSITTGTVFDESNTQGWTAPADTGSQLAGTRVFAIAAGATVGYNLVCKRAFGTSASAGSPQLTAIFTPGP